ncbi:hypothetical protein AB0K00_11835 [Dactylosporangium sp. NPDC049525]|uniref:hypothetical protein n=1 Tax=Dactylosporangium sp. NPDC049525 TaxID=3154730 RepID=UPI00341A5868
MVVRLVRAGVGALLLLIAVPLALAGGGLCVAMEHRAADDTFTARLERLRSGGRAVVVPDIDALLRADAPFARGGQTTLNLSAVGSSGPLFIGLAPDAVVQRYLGGLVHASVSRVRLARGPLPVELTEVQTRAAAASAGATTGQQGSTGAGAQTAGPAQGGVPAVAGPGTEPGSGSGTTGTGDPNATTGGDPGAATGDPNATTAGPNTAAGDPNVNPADPAAPTDPNVAADPNATVDPNATAAGPNATGSAAGANGAGGAIAVPLAVPAGQEFWLAKSITVDGAAQLTWSPSALRGRHLALVVMNADGTAGIDVTVTARLTPAWIGPTAGGLLMLGTALFLLALLVLAWPQRRAEERLVLPTLPSQPAKGRGRASLRRNLSTLSDPIAALLNPVVPKNRDAAPAAVTIEVTSQTEVEEDRQTTTIGVVVTEESPAGEPTAVPTKATAEATAEPAPAEAATAGMDVPAPQEPTGQTSADAAAVDEAAPQEVTVADEGAALAESELDRPAPAAGTDDDGPGPVVLPPLPKLPAIELQFTWAPVAVDEQEEATASS